MNIANIQPHSCISIQAQIDPPGETTQKFSNGISLNDNDFNYISDVSIDYNFAGVIYNVAVPEEATIAQINTTGPSSIVTFKTVMFSPGYYTESSILDKFNGVTNDCLTFDRRASRKFVVQRFRTISYAITFNKAGVLNKIMGFYNNAKKVYYVFVSSSERYRTTQGLYDTGEAISRDSDISAYYPVELNFTTTLVTPIDFNALFVSCDLIEQSSLIGQSYLAMLGFQKGDTTVLQQFNSKCIIPLTKTNFSTINWSLRGIGGELVKINTPITIHIKICSQKK